MVLYKCHFPLSHVKCLKGHRTLACVFSSSKVTVSQWVKLTYRAALVQLKRQKQQRQSLWLKKDRIQFVRQRQGNLVQKNKGKLWIFPHCSSTVSTLTRNYPRFLREHQHINHIVTFHKRKLFTNHVSQLLSSFVPLSSWYVKSAAGKIFEFIQVQWISCKRPSLSEVWRVVRMRTKALSYNTPSDVISTNTTPTTNSASQLIL